MLKIVANVSKKVRIPGLDFSSQSFMAGIEVEVSDGSTPEQLQHRLREVYHLLEDAVDSEIRSYGGVPELDAGSRTLSDAGGHGTQGGKRCDIGDAGQGRQGGRKSRRDPGASFSDDVEPGFPGRQESGHVKSARRSGRTATEAQQKAIHAIAKSKGLDRKMLTDRLREVHGVARVEELSIADASALIDSLKNAS